ncbi:hypothetical protein [Salinimicrobium flavum]|uniref:Uncharacterized protein n=1 Tax=Salinimicrobium flavum TaxID=1737065 RepID=A0ABW5IZI0_9FLAO
MKLIIHHYSLIIEKDLADFRRSLFKTPQTPDTFRATESQPSPEEIPTEDKKRSSVLNGWCSFPNKILKFFRN